MIFAELFIGIIINIKSMRKIIIFLPCLFFALFVSSPVLAHPGNTDIRGCHTCRTNCSSWGLKNGEYHCHQQKALPQPVEPVKSKFSETGGTTVPAPEYKNNNIVIIAEQKTTPISSEANKSEGFVDKNLSNKLKGRIILQVESNGEGWYVNPENNKRHFLGRPADTFSVMRQLGLGISEKDFNSFKDKAPQRLSGKILLRVESSGEAYYVNPVDLKMYFLGKPADAFEVMRNLGLGISNNDIRKIDTN